MEGWIRRVLVEGRGEWWSWLRREGVEAKQDARSGGRATEHRTSMMQSFSPSPILLAQHKPKLLQHLWTLDLPQLQKRLLQNLASTPSDGE
jgi:hypothetical protein